MKVSERYGCVCDHMISSAAMSTFSISSSLSMTVLTVRLVMQLGSELLLRTRGDLQRQVRRHAYRLGWATLYTNLASFISSPTYNGCPALAKSKPSGRFSTNGGIGK
jgi:hypothetical protein